MSIDTAIVKSHRSYVRIEILEGGLVTASTEFSTDKLLAVGGEVTATRRADVRRTASVQFVGADELIPIAADDLLDPLAGRELRLYRGVEDDLRSLAIIRIEDADVEENDSGLAISVSGRDRAVRVSEKPWTSPYTVPNGTNFATAIQNIIENRVGAGVFTYNFSPITTTTTAAISYDTNVNPWQAARKLSDSIGHELYFDPDGVLTLRPVPDPATDPVRFSFVDNDVRIRPLSRRIDGSEVKNGVIVQAEAPWLLFPITGTAWVDDVNSPIRRSRIGERPEIVRDALIFSQAQADAAAAAMLLDLIGVEESVSWQSVPHPGLDVGSIVEIQSKAIGTTPIRVVIETLRTPLSAAEPQEGTTRRRRTT